MTYFVTFLIIGIGAGWVAGLLMESHGFGVAGDMAVGVIGALIGGFGVNVLDVFSYGFWSSVAMAVVGATVLLFIAGLVPKVNGPLGPTQNHR